MMPCALILTGMLLAVPAAAQPIQRLGTDVVPLSEAVRLDLDPRDPRYTGSVEVALRVSRPVATFRLHAEGIDLTRIALAKTGSASPPIVLTSRTEAEGMVALSAPSTIPAGSYTLSIDFTTDFGTHAVGLYRLKSRDEWYAFTQFEAIDARKAFPCWDEPSFKIPWRVTLTVPSEHVAIANTPEESVTTAGGKRTIVFKPTRPLPSYLIAIATGPLETVPVPGTSIPTRIVGPKGSAAFAGEATAMTPAILAAVEGYFGSRYPYEKLDLIAVPEYWYGAMENPGAITFKDEVLLHDPRTITDEGRLHVAVDVAHELAHMWFGDLVTMTWWDDTWLNESFASWMEDKIVAQVYPRFEVDIASVAGVQAVMDEDALLSTHAMRQPVSSLASLLQSADALAYVKGPAVIGMTESWLGPDVFRKGVLAYLEAHRDRNASADDLWSALGRASGKDVKSVLSSFLDQPGVPLVTADLLTGGKVRLTQQRFVNAGAQSPNRPTWKIPMVLSIPAPGGLRTERVLLTKARQVVSLGVPETPAWIHPNAGESGYYRWSLSGDAREALIGSASSLTTRERLGILGNAGALLSSGAVTGDRYVHLLDRFASDPDPHVVSAVIAGLATVRGTFYSDTDDPAFAATVRTLLRPALARIGISRTEGEPSTVTSLRPGLIDMLGRWGHDEAVLSDMRRLAKAYAEQPTSVDPTLAEEALALSALTGDATMFDGYVARFESASDTEVRERYLGALGEFRDPALQDRALDYVFAGPLRPQELFTIPRGMTDTPGARAKTWSWMTAHYDTIREKLPADFIVFLPYFAAGCSTERLAAARTFFSDPRHDAPGTDRELSKVAESVGDCVRLVSREGSAVRAAIGSVAARAPASGSSRPPAGNR